MRACPTCKRPLIRKRFSNGKLEPNPAFARRKHCDTSCRADTWKNADLTVLSIALPYFPSELVARALGRTRVAVMLKAKEVGIRRTARGRSNACRFGQAKRHAKRLACT